MSNHQEFPELTPNVGRALRQADRIDIGKPGWNRRYLSVFLDQVVKGVGIWHIGGQFPRVIVAEELEAVVANLYNPPPPPPTLAEAREAARQLAGPSAEIVHAFLATLGEGVQP